MSPGIPNEQFYHKSFPSYENCFISHEGKLYLLGRFLERAPQVFKSKNTLLTPLLPTWPLAGLDAKWGIFMSATITARVRMASTRWGKYCPHKTESLFRWLQLLAESREACPKPSDVHCLLKCAVGHTIWICSSLHFTEEVLPSCGRARPLVDRSFSSDIAYLSEKP